MHTTMHTTLRTTAATSALNWAAKRAMALVLGLAIATLATTASADTRTSDVSLQSPPVPSLAPMLESVTPAVVNIAVTRTQRMPELRFFGGPRQGDEAPVRRSRGAGSGVVVDTDNGYIVTNHHVVNGADSITVGLQDGRVLQAELLGSDELTDIALLQIDADNLTALPLAEATDLRVGDYVVAIGNPFGIGQTVTSGIISALGRAGINNENYEDFIQTDAAINVGNSGGALVDLHGRLVGVNTAIISGTGTSSGVGFAVPVDMVEAVMGHLLRDGTVRRGQLGVMISDHTPVMEEALQLGETRGALVTQVMPGSAAEVAGVQVSDLVVAVDGRPITSGRELRNVIGLSGINTELSLDVRRDGEELTLIARIDGNDSDAELASRDADAQERRADDSNFFGAQLRDAQSGVEVAMVSQQSRAWAAGLRPGDVIQEVNRQPVTNLADFNREVSGESRLLALTVSRDGQSMLLILS